MGDILFLAHRIPFPPDRGDKMRSFHILKALAELGRVHLASFADDAADLAHAEGLRPLVASLHVEVRRRSRLSAAGSALGRGRPLSVEAFASAGFGQAVTALLADRPIDTIFAFSGQMAQYVPVEREGRRFVMDFVDVDSAKFAAYADQAGAAMAWIYRREARTLAAFECSVARHADLSLFVSAPEAAMFRASSGLGAEKVQVLGNGIDLAAYDPDRVTPVAEAGPLIVFTGQMDYPPNIEAVSAFATQSLATIRAAVPDVRFAIVGRDPTPRVKALAALPGVVVTGAVTDVRPWLAAANLVVAPLLLARGIQNKVLEAMAMARPVVASPAAFEGIEAEPGRELIVAAPDGAAAAVIALLRDPARATAIGAAARARVCARYAWGTQLAPLAGMIGRAPTARSAAA